MIWDTTVHRALMELLLLWGMDSTTLVTPRLWHPPETFTLPVVAQILENPWTVENLEPNFLHPWDSLPSRLSLPFPHPPDVRKMTPQTVMKTLGKTCHRMRRWWEVWNRTYTGLRDTLLAALPVLVLDEEDSVLKARWGEVNPLIGDTWEGDTLPDTTLFRVLQRISFQKIWAEGFEERAFFHAIAPRLRDIVPSLPTGSTDVEGCRIWVGTWGDDTYSLETMASYDLIIDPGGNDRYTNLPSGLARFQVVIDLEGSDFYTGDMWGAPAGGIFGSAWIIDLAGDDVYQGADASLGVGIAGVGGILDWEGRDTYRCRQFCVAAGAWGMGVVEDRYGDDLYAVDVGGEAFARTGGVAILDDHGGNDLYRAGEGRFHNPLLPDFLRGMAQGFAFGYRPYASGGVALLIDRKGSDRYTCPVYGQGSAYWKGMGVLIDLSGSDTYDGVAYVQGAGIHLGVGILLDREGRDRYISRFGPSLGSGHDLSVGVLIDGSGDDIYEVSGGIGMGLANGIGLFVDRQGDDLYRITEPRGLGSGDTARGTGSMGLFADLSGQDRYFAPITIRENATWQRGQSGWGMDVQWEADTQPAVDQDTMGLAAFLDTADLKGLYEEARRWGVGNRRLWVQQVRDALAKRGVDALRFLIPEKLRDPYPLNWRVLKHVVTANVDTSGFFLRQALQDPSDTVQAMAVRLLAEIQDTTAFQDLLGLWSPQKSVFFQRAFLQALSTFANPAACSFLGGLLHDSSVVVRTYATTAYGASGCMMSPLLDQLADSNYTVSQAAFLALKTRDIPEDTLRLRLGFCTAPNPACVMYVRLLSQQVSLTWQTRVLLSNLPTALLRWVPESLRVRLPVEPEVLPSLPFR